MARKNIAGIHNYCDRWCERCLFRDRCAVYEQEQKEQGDENENDLTSNLFFEKLSSNLSKAKNMLEELAQKAGIDLEMVGAEVERSEQQRKKNRKDSEEHPLVAMALDYARTASAWLKTQPGMMEKLETMKEDLTLGIESQARARADMATIKDSLAIIEWYSYFIHGKVSRALMGKLDAIEWQEDLNDPQHDFNGSAKIALISTRNSKDAWIKLFEMLPDQEDDFLNILGTLEKIEREIIQEFPTWNAFVRPGFDELPEALAD